MLANWTHNFDAACLPHVVLTQIESIAKIAVAFIQSFSTALRVKAVRSKLFVPGCLLNNKFVA